jgi:hypothetical protein
MRFFIIFLIAHFLGDFAFQPRSFEKKEAGAQ